MLEVMGVLITSTLILLAFVFVVLFICANLYALVSPYIHNPLEKWWNWFTNRIH